MKKSDRIARDLEQSVNSAVENAKDWAAPRVEAAVDWAVPRLQHGLDTASPKIQEGLKIGSPQPGRRRCNSDTAHPGRTGAARPEDPRRRRGRPPRLHEALDKATPVIAQARDRVVVEYLPRLSDQIGPRLRGSAPHAGERSCPRGRRGPEACRLRRRALPPGAGADGRHASSRPPRTKPARP